MPENQDLPAVTDPFNRMEERALINLIAPAFQRAILAAHAARPEIFGLSESELLEKMDSGERGPGALANALRMKFWFEYDEAQAEHRKMKMGNIYGGLCEPVQFFRQVENPEKVAWILTRPAHYDSAVEEMHLFALSRLRRILEADPMVAGRLDPKIAEIQTKIFQILDTRAKGAVVQKTLNVHSTVPAKKGTEGAKKDELERRIKELEQHAEKQRGKIIDTRVIEVE